MSHRDSFSDGRLNLECRSKAVVLYRTLVQTSNKNCYGQQKSIGSSRVDGTLGPTGHLIVFVSISERGSIRKRGVDPKSLEKRTFQELWGNRAARSGRQELSLALRINHGHVLL